MQSTLIKLMKHLLKATFFGKILVAILWLHHAFILTICQKYKKKLELGFVVDLEQTEILKLTGFVSSRYYISLMDFAQNFIFITSNSIYSRLLIKNDAC